MRREYDFIQNLDAKDVNYVMDKKKEHAAILVQRNWRRLKAEREFRKSRLGKLRDVQDYEKTQEDLDRIQESKAIMEKRRAYFKAKRPDNFFEKISDAELDQVKEQVLDPRKLKSDHDIKQLEFR